MQPMLVQPDCVPRAYFSAPLRITKPHKNKTLFMPGAEEKTAIDFSHFSFLMPVPPLLRQGRVDTDAIRTQEIAAKAGSVIALVAAGLLLSVTLKDFLLGGGAGDAYGDDS